MEDKFGGRTVRTFLLLGDAPGVGHDFYWPPWPYGLRRNYTVTPGHEERWIRFPQFFCLRMVLLEVLGVNLYKSCGIPLIFFWLECFAKDFGVNRESFYKLCCHERL